MFVFQFSAVNSSPIAYILQTAPRPALGTAIGRCFQEECWGDGEGRRGRCSEDPEEKTPWLVLQCG